MPLRCPRPGLTHALEPIVGSSLLFVTDPKTGDDWESVAAELTEAYRLTKAAVVAGWAVIYLVDTDDLLGRNGPGRAMVATGLLSAARSAAMEQRKGRVPVNVLAIEADSDPLHVARWCGRLGDPSGPYGELIRIGGEHLGKSLP